MGSEMCIRDRRNTNDEENVFNWAFSGPINNPSMGVIYRDEVVVRWFEDGSIRYSASGSTDAVELPNGPPADWDEIDKTPVETDSTALSMIASLQQKINETEIIARSDTLQPGETIADVGTRFDAAGRRWETLTANAVVPDPLTVAALEASTDFEEFTISDGWTFGDFGVDTTTDGVADKV